MKKNKKELDELFENTSFEDDFSGLFFREDAIRIEKNKKRSALEEELKAFDSLEDQLRKEEKVSAPVEDTPPEDEEDSTPIEEETPADEEDSTPIEEEIPADEEVSTPVEEETPADEENSTPVEEEIPADEEDSTPVEEETPADEEDSTPVEEETPADEEDSTPIEEEIPADEEDSTPIEEETPADEEDSTPVEEETPADEEEADPLDSEEPEALAAMIAAAILSDTNFTTPIFTDSQKPNGDASEGDTSLSDDDKSSEGEQEEPIAVPEEEADAPVPLAESAPAKDIQKKEKKQKKQKRKKAFVMGPSEIPEGSALPLGLFKRIPGRSRIITFVSVAYVVFLSVLIVLLSMATAKMIDIYEKADPERVLNECIEHISGNRLYNDVVLGVGELKTEYESEKDAAGRVLEAIYSDSKKDYHRVSYGESYISYDVYANNCKIYNIVLSKKAEVNALLDISFWEVSDITFFKESLIKYKSSVKISAPMDAVVLLNGIPLTEENVIDDDYSFFIGSVWESDIPKEARCVLYSVDGIFGEPELSASLADETLSIYTDEEGVAHAKYPTGWVKDYTVSVPKGASLYVNGVLATKISSTGNAPATVFEESAEGLTDIYLIEGLFNDPTLNAYANGIPLGDAQREGDSYSFAFSDDMYHTASITVPAQATVSVNGVLLTDENSTRTELSFAEWSKHNINLKAYMPSELKSAGFDMPEFVRYDVSMLYSTPTVEVTFNGKACTPYKKSSEDKNSSFMFDYNDTAPDTSFVTFAETFARTYLKYMTEGCYGIRDDVEMRKNFYTNWINYLSYILHDTLCYDNALDSYSDVEYRPNLQIVSQRYTVQNVIKYSESVYSCAIVCSVKDTGSDSEVLTIINCLIVVKDGQYKIWSHDTIS